MRRFTLLLAIAILSTAAMAQKRALMEGETPTKGFAKQQTQSKAKDGVTYWYEDFDTERWMITVVQDGEGYLYDQDQALPAAPMGGQWTVAANGEQTTNRDAMYFHWSDVGPRGRYTGNWTEDNPLGSFEPDQSDVDALPDGTSVENGFMMLESDYANTTESGVMPSEDLVFDMDAYIQCGPINLSEAEGAIFHIKTFYRYCCSPDAELALEVSVDYDPADPSAATWGSFKLNNITGGNDYTFQNQVHFNASERELGINISRMELDGEYVAIAGSDNVYIRLHQTLASHYFWIIDDLYIVEPPAKDLVLTDGFADYIIDAEVDTIDGFNLATNFFGGYTTIPEAVVGPFVKFRADVINNGLEDITGAKANVTITKDGAEVYSAEGTESASIEKFESDIVRVETDFTPSTAGVYQALITTSLDGEDGNVNNNHWKYDFTVGGDVWSTTYRGNEESFSSAGPRDWADGGYDGDAIAQEFLFPEGFEQQKIYGINFFFHSHRGRNAELQAIEDGYFGVYGRVWVEDPVADEVVPTNIQTPLKVMSINDTASWVTIPFTDDGGLYLEPGKTYYVGLECYTGTTQVLRFQIGKDLRGPKQPVEGGYVMLTNNGTDWGRTGDNYAIELVLGDEPVVYKKITFNYDTNCDTTLNGVFDPANDTIFISGSFVNDAAPGSVESIRMFKSGSAGVFTGSAFSVLPNATYEYKYYVGSGFDNPLSGSNLTVTIEEDDLVVDDAYNCDTTSIENNAQLSTIEVYPNPFKNTLVVSNLENASTITISNVIGQLVKTVDVDAAKVEISTADLDAGIYVVSVTDANNNTTTQRVVKQ